MNEHKIKGLKGMGVISGYVVCTWQSIFKGSIWEKKCCKKLHHLNRTFKNIKCEIE